jgi:hypothetical protein
MQHSAEFLIMSSQTPREIHVKIFWSTLRLPQSAESTHILENLCDQMGELIGGKKLSPKSRESVALMKGILTKAYTL